MVETRAAPRHRVMKPAQIEFGGYKRECVVRDTSTTGAALEVMDQASIPRHFNLIVPEDTVTLLDIELALRDGGAYSYLIACQGKMVQVVLGMKDWLAALKAAGLSPDANLAALADRVLTAWRRRLSGSA